MRVRPGPAPDAAPWTLVFAWPAPFPSPPRAAPRASLPPARPSPLTRCPSGGRRLARPVPATGRSLRGSSGSLGSPRPGSPAGPEPVRASTASPISREMVAAVAPRERSGTGFASSLAPTLAPRGPGRERCRGASAAATRSGECANPHGEQP
jgi:hypothetical protein